MAFRFCHGHGRIPNHSQTLTCCTACSRKLLSPKDAPCPSAFFSCCQPNASGSQVLPSHISGTLRTSSGSFSCRSPASTRLVNRNVGGSELGRGRRMSKKGGNLGFRGFLRTLYTSAQAPEPSLSPNSNLPITVLLVIIAVGVTVFETFFGPIFGRNAT